MKPYSRISLCIGLDPTKISPTHIGLDRTKMLTSQVTVSKITKASELGIIISTHMQQSDLFKN